VLEVDITSSSVDRMVMYALLKVREVWVFDGQAFTFQVLQADGSYTGAPTSPIFPFLKPADLLPFLALQPGMDENAVVRQFRAWLRQQPGAGPQPTP